MTSLRAASPASALNFPCSPRPVSGSLCPFQRRPPGTKRSSSISCRGSLRSMRPVTHPCPCLLRAPPTTSTHALGIWGSVIVTVALIPGANLEGFRTPAETAQSQPAYSSPLALKARPPTYPLPAGALLLPKALLETLQALGLALCKQIYRPTPKGTQGQCGSGGFMGEPGNSEVESPCQGCNYTWPSPLSSHSGV